MHTRNFSKTGLVIMALMFSLAASALSQQPNSSTHSMTFNGFDPGTYPIQTSLLSPAPLSISISGAPGAAGSPFILVQAAGLITPGFQVTPAEIVDIDPLTMTFIMDGTNAGGDLINQFAVLGSSGTISLQLMSSAPVVAPTTVGAFQSVIVDPAAVLGFTLTAATALTLVNTPPFGTVHYSRGNYSFLQEEFSTVSPDSPVPGLMMPASYDMPIISLAGFQQGYVFGSHPWWRKDFASLPAGLSAMNVFENVSFRHVKTEHGDLYAFQDNTASPNEYGFALQTPTGLAPIPGSVMAGNNGGATMPFEAEIQVQGNRLAAVLDPVTGNDSLLLVSLDGPTLSGATDATNLGSGGQVGLLDESLTLTQFNVFCVGGSSTTASMGPLLSAPNDGSAPLAVLTLPPGPSMGGPVIYVDAEIRCSDDRSITIFQGGPGYANEDLYMITDTAPGVFTVTNLTQFPVASEIEEFGDDSGGNDNQIAISPSKTRVAFIEYKSSREELMIVNVAAPGVLTHVTNATNFVAGHGDVIELHWADDNTLLFFCGTGVTTLDLYSYNVTTGAVSNLTHTNGQFAPPFSGSSNVDPDAVFFNPARTHMFFQRDGGTDGIGNPTNNLIAVNLATRTLTDITGNEFAGGTTAHADTTGSYSGMHLQFARNSDICVLISELSTGTDDNVWAFDAAAPGPARQLTNNSGNAFKTIDNLSLDDSGASVAFGDNITGQELLYVAQTGVAMSATTLYTPPPPVTTGSIADGSIQWTAFGQIVFAYGTGTMPNPSDATLMIWDSGYGTFTLDSLAATYWIY